MRPNQSLRQLFRGAIDALRLAPPACVGKDSCELVETDGKSGLGWDKLGMVLNEGTEPGHRLTEGRLGLLVQSKLMTDTSGVKSCEGRGKTRLGGSGAIHREPLVEAQGFFHELALQWSESRLAGQP